MSGPPSPDKSWPLHPVNGIDYRYRRVFGTGGIGSGIVFVLEGHETLRRDESRFGRLLPSRDYCKLHIVFHYIASLLNGGAVYETSQNGVDPIGIQVLPIGKVGNDSQGKRLHAMMRDTGMDVRGVTFDPEQPTMFSVCIQYEDGSGGNVTTSTSASNQVSEDDVDQLLDGLVDETGSRDVMVALPEVPLSSRLHLLDKGRAAGSFTVASCTSSEIATFYSAGGIEKTDLLAINMDEAAALLGTVEVHGERQDVVKKCIEMLTRVQPNITVTITDGARGSYGYHRGHTEFVPALKGEIVQTGGAGDAYVAGIITGLVCGLPFHKGTSDEWFGETALLSAMELGTLLASISLTSVHSLHETIDVQLVKQYASRFDWSSAWNQLFKH